MPDTYKLILSNGQELDGLTLNGNNYIADYAVTPETFAGGLAPVTIVHGDESETHDNMALVQITQSGGKWWIVLRDYSAAELAAIQLRADIDYLSMALGVSM